MPQTSELRKPHALSVSVRLLVNASSQFKYDIYDSAQRSSGPPALRPAHVRCVCVSTFKLCVHSPDFPSFSGSLFPPSHITLKAMLYETILYNADDALTTLACALQIVRAETEVTDS